MATINPHAAVGMGFSLTARIDVAIAVSSPTSRSMSSGNDTRLIDIATNALTPAQIEGLAANVSAASVPRHVFDALMLGASVVVVPLQTRADRSSGQTTYVNAMARGKAIVITDTPGVRDYIEDGETGRIVPPEDPVALAAAVRQLLENPGERTKMGERARARALGHLSLTHYARRLLGVVDEILGS